jgi:carbon starvation protein CstA
MNVFIILGVLFLALVIIIPLVEKSNVRMSDETTAKISRWIWPLLIVLIVLGAFKALF